MSASNGESGRISPFYLILFILNCLIWGTTWYAIRVGLESGVPSFRGAALRFLLVSVMLLAIVLFRKAKIPSSFRELKAPLLLGVFYFFVPYACTYWSENYIPSALAAVIYGSLPLAVMMFSHFMLEGERISLMKSISVIVGITGVLVISLAKGTQTQSQQLHSLGVGAMVIALISTAYCTSYTKRHVATNDIFVFLGIQTLVGGIMLMALSLIVERPFTLKMESAGLFSILYLAIIGTVAGWTMWIYLISKLSPVVVSYNCFLIPIVALVVGVVLGQERFSYLTIVGTAFVLASVLMIIRARKVELRRSVSSE